VDELSENEQVEAVKAWLRRNGPAIVGGLALGALLVFGWRWWQARQAADALQANTAYEQLVQSLAGDVPVADVEKRLAEFNKAWGRSAYASTADLAVASLLVERDALPQATVPLRRVLETSRDDTLREVARARLARVLLAQDKADEALAVLDAAPEDSRLEAAYAEARGDVLLAKGDRAAALKAYQDARAASASLPSSELGRRTLDLKINDLEAEATP
jgi:predicted negative regulator of RcsB-dependent stress response